MNTETGEISLVRGNHATKVTRAGPERTDILLGVRYSSRHLAYARPGGRCEHPVHSGPQPMTAGPTGAQQPTQHWPVRAAFHAERGDAHVGNRLNRPKGSTRAGQVRHLLSYLATCGVCGAPVQYANSSTMLYRCYRFPLLGKGGSGHTQISAPVLDQAITAVVLGQLSKPEFRAQFMPDDGGEIIVAENELADTERRYALIEDTVAGRAQDDQFTRDTAAGYLARIAGLKEQIRALQTPRLLKDFADGDVEATWNRTLIPVRRDIIKALLSAIEVQRDQVVTLHWRKTPGPVPAGRKPGDGMITLIEMAEAREVALR